MNVSHVFSCKVVQFRTEEFISSQLKYSSLALFYCILSGIKLPSSEADEECPPVVWQRQ